MGHNIRWDNEDKTVVLQEYTDDATKDDFFQLAQKSSEMLKTVHHTVHLIIDERKVNLLLNASDLTRIKQLVPKNEGAVLVVVLPSRIKLKVAIKELNQKLMQTMYPNTYFFESLEEARQFLQQEFNVCYSS